MTNTFAVLRLLPMTDREKGAETLVLRHRITLLERQLDGTKARFTDQAQALPAALLHRVPPGALRRMRLLVRPDKEPRRVRHRSRTEDVGTGFGLTHLALGERERFHPKPDTTGQDNP